MKIIVCGGSSLIATGLVERTTRDLDIVALLDRSNRIKTAKPLPEALVTAGSQVARDLGLVENWLNNEPAALLKLGLPDGFLDRIHEKRYGECLTVNFIGRYDQIHFKVYAAVDQGPGRHVDDLRALHPTEVEMGDAARWALTHDRSDGFRKVLKEMLTVLGYASVAEKF
jgi:hypothetical protein